MVVVNTRDGSSTILVEQSGLTYHSMHGAVQESQHVFIEAGLTHCIDSKFRNEIRIFEMGLGTGLNCLLTYAATIDLPINVFYTAVELNPLPESIYSLLNYCQSPALFNFHKVFQKIHCSAWNQQVFVAHKFELEKIQADIVRFVPNQTYDLIYFDAFSQEANPDQWTEPVFRKLYDSMDDAGVLVTYSSKVIVRRALEAAGFIVQKIPGPHGKREIVRALKQK